MNFIDDKEKMEDLKKLTKEEFLETYSYITEKEYDETFVEYIKDLVQEICDNTEDLDIKTMGYILQNSKDENDIYVLVSDSDYDNSSLINIFYPERTESTPEWDFSFNDYLYEMLADGYEIKWMNEDTHPNIWEDIYNGFDEETIRDDEGMQLYMKYCKENGITHEKINSKNNIYPNIMQFFIEEKMPKKITRLDFLNECKDIIVNNIFCYSQNYLMTIPKDNYKKEWNEENQKLKIVKKMISEEKQKNKKIDRER